MRRTAALLAGMMVAHPALAEPERTADPEIVVVGSRAAPRSSTESLAPVDVYSNETLVRRGLTDLPRALQFIAPSLNYPRSATGPSAANNRPATLRGLSTDEVLVLVNGKRWHGSSTIVFNNVVGRGSVPVDLAAIPIAAVARIEVLRDGAAAQYGSDAIAGVINIVLKTDAAGGSVAGQTGFSDAGDGGSHVATFNTGMKLGDGALNLTAEMRKRETTNRVAVDSRFGRITGQQGDPDSIDLNTALNLVTRLGDVELYGDAVYAHRNSMSPAQYRAPTIAPVLFPNGFVPHIRLQQDDVGGTVGLRGTVGGFTWDLSDTPGYNQADFVSRDTLNTSLGVASPTSFDAGGSRYFQNVVNLTLARRIDWLAGGNVALGGEYRHERYSIRSGEPASFTGAGAQGFPGYNPPSPVSLSRDAEGAFLDAELKPIAALSLGGAVRYEHYSDFGDAVTGKVSALLRPAAFVAFRGTASTGFRAPSLQQIGFSTVTSQASAGVLVNIGTFAVNDPVARALGATPLRRERSRSLSGGVTLTPGGGFTLTGDVYQIAIKDRIALSDTLSGAAVAAVLRAAGITNASQARFFTNALDTTTDGFEIVGRWHGAVAATRVDVDVAYARNTTKVDRLAANVVAPTLPLLGTMALDLLTTAQPRDKLIAAATIERGPFRVSADVTRFGTFKALSLVAEQVFAAKTTVDLTADIRMGARLTLGLGVLNVGNTYPDLVVDRALSQGGSLQYPEVGGLGTNGREYFAKVAVRF